VKLLYRLWEESGETREQVRVINGSRVVAQLTNDFGSIVQGQLVYMPWRAPPRSASPLRFCVTAFDRPGNQSGESCARLTLR
jgi:hypothetical protein